MKDHLKLQMQHCVPELLAFNEKIHGVCYDRQYLLPLVDYTVIVGVNGFYLVEPEVVILEVRNVDGIIIIVDESDYIEILTSLNYRD